MRSTRCGNSVFTEGPSVDALKKAGLAILQRDPL